jgi:hypothetical protein
MLRLIGTPLRPQNVFTAILLPGLLSPLVLLTEVGPRSLGTGSGTVQGLRGVTDGSNATSGLCPSVHKSGCSSWESARFFITANTKSRRVQDLIPFE